MDNSTESEFSEVLESTDSEAADELERTASPTLHAAAAESPLADVEVAGAESCGARA